MRKKLANLGRIHCVVSILWILGSSSSDESVHSSIRETRQI